MPQTEQIGKSRRRYGTLARLRRLGWPLVEAVYNIGTVLRFSFKIAMCIPSSLRRFSLIWTQIFTLGTLSLPIVVVSGAFIGFVLGLQFYTILDRYGQTQLVGAAAALTLFRELGPVLTALLYIGSACTSVTAAIGLKRASEQIAAMEVMAVDPIKYEITPRFIAGMISLPLLTIIMLGVSIMGTYFMAVIQIGLDEGFFWSNMQRLTRFFGDFTEGLFKSFVFAIFANLIALYQGFGAHPTAEGVARATTRTVVLASLVILGMDFIITSFFVDN